MGIFLELLKVILYLRTSTACIGCGLGFLVTVIPSAHKQFCKHPWVSTHSSLTR